MSLKNNKYLFKNSYNTKIKISIPEDKKIRNF